MANEMKCLRIESKYTVIPRQKMRSEKIISTSTKVVEVNRNLGIAYDSSMVLSNSISRWAFFGTWHGKLKREQQAKFIKSDMNSAFLCITMIISSLVMTRTTNALSQSIVVVGLNAALQKRFVLSPGTNLEPGNVHRAYKTETGVGGKGQDVGVALSCLILSTQNAEIQRQSMACTCEDKVMLAQFLGTGPEGDTVLEMLQSKFRLSTALTVRNAAPLRTCTTIVGADQATELVETSGEVTASEMMNMHSKIEELTNRDGRANCVCIMGSLSPGCEEQTYAELLSRLADSNTLVLIDSVIGLEPLLNSLKTIFSSSPLKQGGAVLKLNAAEICKLAGVARSETKQVTMEELISSARGFVTKYADAIKALDYLCITDGKFPAYLVEIPSVLTNFRAWQLPSVDLSNSGTLYPIGAGDTVAAGTLAAWQYLHHSNGVVSSKIGNILLERKAQWSGGEESTTSEMNGYSMATAFAFGLACGSASCLRPENSVFEVDDAIKFFGSMVKPVVRYESNDST